MGVSSDGMLSFGFEVGGEDEPPAWMADYEDFDDFLCAKGGLPINSGYAERKPVIDACPAELYRFCSWEYPMYILGVRGAEHCVNRGYTKEINAAELTVDQAKINAFKTWCNANEIEWQEPKWLLCSMYG